MPSNNKVLIVEDDHFLSGVVGNALKKNGFSVLQAFDGEEAMEILKTEKPNLIILDIIMPKVSGFDVLRRISSDPELSAVPTVVFSNLGQEGDVEKAKSLGVVDYQVKASSSISKILEKVKEILPEKS